MIDVRCTFYWCLHIAMQLSARDIVSNAHFWFATCELLSLLLFLIDSTQFIFTFPWTALLKRYKYLIGKKKINFLNSDCSHIPNRKIRSIVIIRYLDSQFILLWENAPQMPGSRIGQFSVRENKFESSKRFFRRVISKPSIVDRISWDDNERIYPKGWKINHLSNGM